MLLLYPYLPPKPEPGASGPSAKSAWSVRPTMRSGCARLDAARLLLDLRQIEVAPLGRLELLVDARETLLERVLG
eukprot:6061790-Prymnesium_polylepis.1